MNTQKELVKTIRTIMRHHGKRRIWNNLYYTGNRTVKCYANLNDERTDEQLVSSLQTALNSVGAVYEIRMTKTVPAKYNKGTGAIIVGLHRLQN